MANGPDGVKHIYPTLQGAEIWYIDVNNPEDRIIGGSISGSHDNGFETSAERLSVVTSAGFSGVPQNVDHGQIAQQGFMDKEEDWRDVEMTAHWNLQDIESGSSSPSFQLHCRGADHITPSPWCPGFMYSSEIGTDGRHRFHKEQFHRQFAPATDWITTGLGNLENKGWFGHKFMVYNVDIGGGELGVKLECWVDPNVDNNWVKVDERLDDGGWGSAGTSCGGTADQIGTWGGPLATFRFDFVQGRFRNTSVRSISVTGQFPPDPGDPPPPEPSPTPPPPGGGADVVVSSIHHYRIGTFSQPVCHGEDVPPPTQPPPPSPPPGTGFVTQMKQFAAGYNLLEFGDTSSVGTSENE